MTDFHYDPVPLDPPQRLTDTEMLRSAIAHCEFVSKRRSVRDFSHDPVDRAVIEACLLAAGSAPSGANHQPWHFVCINDVDTKRAIRDAAEAEEQAFYGGRAGDAWLNDLKKIGTDASVFAERYAHDEQGQRKKNYYVPESVGIATGFLINALHQVGLATLTHTPNPMKFLNQILDRPSRERPFLLLVVGHPAQEAMVPRAATVKKSLNQIATFF